MIGHIRGTVLWRDIKSVVVDVSGVGYKIFTYSGGVDTEKEVSFFTYLAVKETALDLYGFVQKEELDFFELLLTVSGIGPKSAMAILSVAPLETLYHAIQAEDASSLTKTSGIGKKNAEKIVLELKGKLSDTLPHTPHHTEDADAFEALKSLGYSEKDIRDALKKSSGTTTEEKVRGALRNLQ
jgi:Holliday junction DNA helicase RuvA